MVLVLQIELLQVRCQLAEQTLDRLAKFRFWPPRQLEGRGVYWLCWLRAFVARGTFFARLFAENRITSLRPSALGRHAARAGSYVRAYAKLTNEGGAATGTRTKGNLEPKWLRSIYIIY